MSEARVVWNPKARKKIHPRRGTPGLKSKKRDPKATWGAVRNIYAVIADACNAALEKRPKSAGDVHVNMKLTHAAVARLESKTPPPGPYDPVVEASMRGLFEFAIWHDHMPNVIETLIEHWLAVGGVELALEALVNAPKFWWAAIGDMLAVRDGFDANDFGYDEFRIDWWFPIRFELATADDATYARARALATRHFASGDLGVKSALAYAFPAEKAWAVEAAEARLAISGGRAPPCLAPLLGSLVDVDLVDRVAERAGWALPYGHSLLDAIGVDATPALLNLFSKLRLAREKREGLAVLELIESDVVAAHFASLIDETPLREIVFAYFDRAPQLAETALAARAAKDGKTSEAAKVLSRIRAKR